MARAHGKILSTIWDDPDWLARTAAAQRCYFLLVSHPRLSLVGRLDYRPSRLARYAADTTPDSIEDAVKELEASRFVLVDRDTEEIVVRTIVRHDLPPHRRNENMLKGLWRAWEAIESRQLRALVVENIPDSLWEDRRCQPHPEARAIRDQLSQTPTSQRIEPPVETTGSDQQSESVAPTSVPALRLSGSPAEPSFAAATASEEAPVDNSQQQTTSSRVDEAIEVLVERHHAVNETKGPSIDRHKSGTRKGKRTEFGQRLTTLALDHPDWTAVQLADAVTPRKPAEPSGAKPLYEPAEIVGELTRDQNAAMAASIPRSRTKAAP